jgi:hypothetical protein
MSARGRLKAWVVVAAAGAGAWLGLGPGSPGVVRSTAVAPDTRPEASGDARDAVRAMATFLSAAPPKARVGLGIRAQEAAPAAADAPITLTPYETLSLDARLHEVGEYERRIDGYYPHTESGVLIRRYVALTLAAVDTETLPELSRLRIEHDLLQDPAASARDLQATLNSIPADSEEERAVLLKLAENVGSTPQGRPTVEAILGAEIQRQVSAGPAGLAESRAAQLIDDYSTIVQELPKQIRFLRAGIASQPDPLVNEMLRARLESLQAVAEGASAGDGANDDASAEGREPASDIENPGG